MAPVTMNHTPAPWTNRPGTLQVRSADDKLVANALCGTMRRFTTTPPERPRAEAEANARLIASAPALLDVAMRLVALSEHCKAQGLSSLLVSARAAIAQATGE